MKWSKDFMRDQDFGLLVLRISTGGLMLFHEKQFRPHTLRQQGGGWIDNETAGRFRILSYSLIYFLYPGFCFRFLLRLSTE